MKESITIRNLGPLKNIHIEDIKPFTLIIGPSAAGKSTLMKTIALMRYIFKMNHIRAYLRNAGISKSPFKLRFASLLHDGLQIMVNKDTYIEYRGVINGNTYSIVFENGKLAQLGDIPNEDLYFLKESFISETRSIIPTWASKGSSAKGIDLGFFFHETFNDFNAATDKIKELELGYLNLKMKVQKTGSNPKKYVISGLEDNSDAIELRYASSGIQTSTPLVTIIKYFAQDFSFKDAFRRSVLSYLYDTNDTTRISNFKPEVEQTDLKRLVHVHIEEPELSLDPEAQRLMVNNMIDYAFHKKEDDREINIMIATHSPYIANHLNVLIRAGYYQKSREQYPFINADAIAAFSLDKGHLTSLMATDNNSGQKVINTINLSTPIENIANDYMGINE